MARFVNSRVQAPFMNPDRTGLAVFAAFAVFLVLDRGFGMILLFWRAANLARCQFVALPAPRADAAAGFVRGSTAFFVTIDFEESKCEEG